MYEPKVNDYFRWTTALGMVHEGWVYFKAEPSENKKGWQTPARYISIEIATKPRPQCDLSTFLHKNITVLCDVSCKIKINQSIIFFLKT